METLTVGELLEVLKGVDPETPVFLAMQPSWPFEYTIGDVQVVEPTTCGFADGSDPDGEHDHAACEDVVAEGIANDDPRFKTRVYISEGQQTRYLPGEVSRELGWR